MKARPLHLSATPGRVDLSEVEFGAAMLGRPLTEQGRVMARVLQSSHNGVPRYSRPVICAPRRVAKTTTVWATLLGRCSLRDGYQVFAAAQTGVKGRDRFLSVVRALRIYGGPHAPRIYLGAGHERLEWPSGSFIAIVPPEGSSFRGDGANAVLLDEGQEIPPDKTGDLLAAVLPLTDTLPDSQVIVAGTAGRYRSGLLWESLELGREAAPGFGIVEYAAAPGSDPADEAVWAAVHPGLGSLTTIEVLRQRYREMDADTFAAEYLGIWREDAAANVIPPAAWARGALAVEVPRPARFALGVDCDPAGLAASIVAAWRMADGRAVVEVIDHRPGTAWVPARVLALYERYRCPVVYDRIGTNEQVMASAERAKSRVEGVHLLEVTASASAFLREVTEGGLAHRPNDDLDNAVAAARKRTTGKAWAWGSKDTIISPLVAASLALWAFDKMPQAAPARIVS